MTDVKALGRGIGEWKAAAIAFGERLGSIGPDGYYEFTPEQWYAWAVAADSRLDAERLALKAELAEERRRVERLRDDLWDSAQWKAKFDAAREVALSFVPGRDRKEAKRQLDAEIAAKLKSVISRPSTQ